MNKKRIIWLVVLVSIFGILLYVRGQQESEARTKAFDVAVQKARDMGIDVNKMSISKEIPTAHMLIVSFKSKKENNLNDLEIWMRCEYTNSIETLGVFKDVDPVKDHAKIAAGILKGAIDEIKNTIKGKTERG